MRTLHILSCLMLSSMLLQASPVSDDDRQYFIDSYAEIAVEEMRVSNIPASITLAQAILESSWGQGPVAQGANNFFCIKCYNGWEGPTFDAKDDEPGLSCFRKYNNILESFRDHSSFLKDNVRYQKLFQYETTDYRSWATGLKECGYATDQAYGDKLIGLIEAYGLWMYDYAIQAVQFDVLATPVMEEDILADGSIVGPELQRPNPEPQKENHLPSSLLAVPDYDLGEQQMQESAVPSWQGNPAGPDQPIRKRNTKIRPIVPLSHYVPQRI